MCEQLMTTLPYLLEHKAHQDFRRQIQEKNIHTLMGYKTQGNLVQYFPGKKRLMVLIY